MEFEEATRQRIAAAVRERRARLGLSQEQAARTSGGMISTANLRIVEGAGRASFRPKTLIGIARALSWPNDAVEQIAAGVDPETFPPVAPDGRPLSGSGPSAGGLELVTAQQLADLRHQVDEQRQAISELGRRLAELGQHVGSADQAWSSGLLAAAVSGDLCDAAPEGPRRTTRRRVESFDPAADD